LHRTEKEGTAVIDSRWFSIISVTEPKQLYHEHGAEGTDICYLIKQWLFSELPFFASKKN